jgi:hypothetical protein
MFVYLFYFVGCVLLSIAKQKLRSPCVPQHQDIEFHLQARTTLQNAVSRRLFNCYDQCLAGDGFATVFGPLRPLPSDEVHLKTKLFNAAQARRRLYFYIRKAARLVDVAGAITMTFDGNIKGGGGNKIFSGFSMNDILPEAMRNEVSTHLGKK